MVDESGDLDKLTSDLKNLLLDSTSDSIFLHDQKGNFIYINQAAYKTRGYTKDELMGMNLYDLDVPEFAARINPRIADLMEKGEITFEAAHSRKDGSVMPVEIHTRIIEYGNQNLVLSSVRDISRRKKAEKKLANAYDELELKVQERTAKIKQSKEKLRLVNSYNRELINVNIDPIFIIGPEGKITDANNATETVTGCSRE